MPAPSTTSSRPALVAALSVAACGAAFQPAAAPIAGQNVSAARLDEAFAAAEVVFVGVAIEFSRDPPPIDPHGDFFTPVTYRVLERWKGGDVGARVTVMHRARFASATVDDELRLRGDVFGAERPLVVFARSERGRLQSADRDMTTDAESLGIVAATPTVLSRLRQRRDAR